MNVEEFLRLFHIRAPNTMWFLGAGASAAAGLPTAYDMIWDFKRTLFCSAQRVTIQSCSDLSNPALRARIQQYFDSLGTFPTKDSEDEYAYYFETTYPSELDRRRYIDRMISGASPSYGHIALAALLKMDKVRALWTTNFDRMVEDAAIPLLGSSGKLIVATPDTREVAMQAMNEGRWPLLAKIHGDFHSRRLKNTTHELRAQDAELRRALVEACKRYGLAVVGYSGRDQSVMDALEEAIDDGHGYPAGLFWFHRSQSRCLPRVNDLIAKAAAKGIEAKTVAVETFDELMADLLLLLPEIPHEIVVQLNTRAQRISDAPVPQPSTSKSWPIVRLNALPVVAAPTICRRVVCKIGGAKEVREAVEESKLKLK